MSRLLDELIQLTHNYGYLKIEFDPALSLSDAKKWVERFREHPRTSEGVNCPCCGQLAKVYPRTITSSMAYVLILLERHFRKFPKDWLHVPSYLTKTCKIGSAVRGGDWAKLVHWDLIVKKPELREDKSRRNGKYKLGPKAVSFVRGRLELPRYAYIYNGTLLRMSEEKITIHDALKRSNRFDYAALMR